MGQSARPVLRALGTACVVLLAICSSSALASAQPVNRNPQRERRIEQQLQSIAPEALPDFKAATVAMDQNNHAEAARLFRQVLQRAPRFSPALRRLGYALFSSGQRQAARDATDQAIAIERSPENLISLAEMLMQPVDGQPPSQIAREYALRLAQEASEKARGEDDPSYLFVKAQLALSLQREQEFRETVRALNERFPTEMATHYFSAILSAFDGRWTQAERDITEAQRLGLPAETATEFLDSGVRTYARIQRTIRYTLIAVALWVAGLVLLFLAGKALSRKTLDSIERADATGVPSPRELTLRRIYRRLIGIAATYYYVSLPFVIVSVIAFAALVIYAFLLLGRMPIYFVAALVIGGFITIVKSVQSIFMRISPELPGRPLEAVEAPELWRLTREVAAAVGTRPVDEIRVTPGIDMAVYEAGTRHERREDRARRVLLLGVGLLDGFRQGSFCAVLAHEYGHFAHRDTAGGELAMRVQNDMMKFAVALVNARQNTRLNVAWHFLRAYSFLFRRISHGATRLQEVLADRVAAVQYGAQNFEDGLRHVVRRHVEFVATVNGELREAIEHRRPVRNVYAIPVPETTDVEREVEEALARPTTEDDSHPGPLDRFRLLSGVTASRQWPASGFVWDLFVDRERLVTEMTAHFASQVEHALEPEEEAAPV